jgi:hypothetical protein
MKKHRGKLIFFLILIVAFLRPRPISACSCLTPEPSFLQLDAVFSGRVLAVLPLIEDERETRLVFFAVSNVWKGTGARFIAVRTGIGGGDCGINFTVGQRAIVHGHKYEDQLWTGICSGTRAWSDELPDYLTNQAKLPLTVLTAFDTQAQTVINYIFAIFTILLTSTTFRVWRQVIGRRLR